MQPPHANASRTAAGSSGRLRPRTSTTPAATSATPATCQADVAAPSTPALTASTSTGADPRASG